MHPTHPEFTEACDEPISNPSSNPELSTLLPASEARRQVLVGGLAGTAALAAGGLPLPAIAGSTGRVSHPKIDPAETPPASGARRRWR